MNACCGKNKLGRPSLGCPQMPLLMLLLVIAARSYMGQGAKRSGVHVWGPTTPPDFFRPVGRSESVVILSCSFCMDLFYDLGGVECPTSHPHVLADKKFCCAKAYKNNGNPAIGY